jgi:hypothetical protein
MNGMQGAETPVTTERTPPDPSEMPSGQARLTLNGLKRGEHLTVAVDWDGCQRGWCSCQHSKVT